MFLEGCVVLSAEQFADIISHNLYSIPVLQIRDLKLRKVNTLPGVTQILN